MAGVIGLAVGTSAPCAPGPLTDVRFEVILGAGQGPAPSGRLFIVLGPRGGPEPRLRLGQTDDNAPLALARDLDGLQPGESARLDRNAFTYPPDRFERLPPGDYQAQAVLDLSRDLRSPNAPGNRFSAPRIVSLTQGAVVRFELTECVPPQALPADTDRIRFVEVPSPLLSAFHGRPIKLRAGVLLPRDFDRDAPRPYPLRVEIGGFGARATALARKARPFTEFRRAWDADDAPRMVLLHLDGAGPLGDPYQVNSANHGPYGDAITRELVPAIEERFHCGGPGRRVLTGGSTGGWVALALQVFYPDFFNGAWAFCPDPVDFRSFQLVNIYEDANAYLAADGKDRPSARDPRTGATLFTIRHECGMENVLGAGGSYALSGQQWGSWNATFSPRGADGQPRTIWDARTGAIDKSVAEHWRKYDLRQVLEANWPVLGPKLRGKLHIWVGEADDYFLNEAVHRLDAFLSRADPPYEGSIRYGPGQGHCWMGTSEAELLAQMARATHRQGQD